MASHRMGEILQPAGVGEQRVLPPNLVKRWSLCCTETRSSGDKTQMPLFSAFVCGDPASDRIYIGYPADDIFGLPKKGRHNFVFTYLIILFTYLFVFFLGSSLPGLQQDDSLQKYK